MGKILLTNKPEIGALSEFIDLLTRLQNEFELQTITIGAIDTDNRNMYAELDGRIGRMKLDYNYYESKFYIEVLNNDEDNDEICRMKNLIKEIVEQK